MQCLVAVRSSLCSDSGLNCFGVRGANEHHFMLDPGEVAASAFTVGLRAPLWSYFQRVWWLCARDSRAVCEAGCAVARLLGCWAALAMQVLSHRNN